MKARKPVLPSEANCLYGYGEVMSSETQKLLTSEFWFNFAVTTGWWGALQPGRLHLSPPGQSRSGKRFRQQAGSV